MKNYQTAQKLLVGDTETDNLESLMSLLMPLSPHKVPSKSTNRFKSLSHNRSLNVRHYGIVEAARLKNVASRSSSTALPAYQMS
jgi:hypothetical protein